MTHFVFPAIIKYARSDRAYTVTFPDLPECATFGDTLDEAKRMAAEALSGYLASIFERNVRMPNRSKRKGKNIYLDPARDAGAGGPLAALRGGEVIYGKPSRLLKKPA